MDELKKALEVWRRHPLTGAPDTDVGKLVALLEKAVAAHPPQSEPQGLREAARVAVLAWQDHTEKFEYVSRKMAELYEAVERADTTEPVPADGGLRVLLQQVIEAANARMRALNNSRAHAMNHTRPSSEECAKQSGTAEHWHLVRAEAEAALSSLPATPTLEQVLAWLRARPGASWVATIRDIEEVVKDLNSKPATPEWAQEERK